MSVKLITVTPDAEKIVAFCARVSSPNQENPEIEKLINYCIKNNHWSILEQASMTIEIETSRGIAPQILRHRSFSFQEFSLRYAKAQEFIVYPGRSQDKKNRQNSIDDLDAETQAWFIQSQQLLNDMAKNMYEEALKKGIAKECARNLLTMGTKTKMYMTGSLRSWATYLNVRLDKSTQKEHREIAKAIKEIFKKEFPIIYKALEETYPVFKDEN